MDKNILVKEQKQFKQAQNLIESKLSYYEEELKRQAFIIKDNLEYVQIEKLRLDRFDKAEIYTEAVLAESKIFDFEREKDIYTRVLPKPFFARIDFSENGEQSYYVGVKTITRPDNSIMVLDWRSPVCSLLYFSPLGKTSYQSKNGKAEVVLNLKRQFRLKPNQITAYFDTETKIDDAILQDALSSRTSSYMTNIVQTIQEEQNEIIRKPDNKNVLINGVAGSGKTSIAMHRIAYLLFVNKGSIKSENILVISPNKLFSSYIKEVLPELGEENVLTLTTEKLFKAFNLLPSSYGKKYDMVRQVMQNKQLIEEVDTKFSCELKDKIDEFLQNLEVRNLIFNVCKEEFEISYADLFKIKKLKSSLDFDTKVRIYLEEYLKNKYVKYTINKIDRLVEQALIEIKESLNFAELQNKVYERVGLNAVESLSWQDVPIYAYIKTFFYPEDKNLSIKHIFIDEMQDYDVFTLAIIKKLYPNAVVTIAGDYNQNLLSNNSNLNFLLNLYNAAEDKLDVSYRSTNEIITFAKNVIGDNSKSKNVIRSGSPVVVKQTATAKDFIFLIKNIEKTYPNEKIAILTKTEEEGASLKKELKNFNLIVNEEDEKLLTSNKLITTIYLSKGLEYDRVVIYDVSKNNFSTSLDRKNLYVASTRALHGLFITYKKQPSDFINFVKNK